MSDPNHMGIVQKNVVWGGGEIPTEILRFILHQRRVYHIIQSFAISTFSGAETD